MARSSTARRRLSVASVYLGSLPRRFRRGRAAESSTILARCRSRCSVFVERAKPSSSACSSFVNVIGVGVRTGSRARSRSCLLLHSDTLLRRTFAKIGILTLRVIDIARTLWWQKIEEREPHAETQPPFEIDE